MDPLPNQRVFLDLFSLTRILQLSRNAVFGLTNESFPCPRPIADHKTTIKDFMSTCTDYSQIIFRLLSDALSLEPHERFESFHRPAHPSPDMVRLLKYHEHRVRPDAPYVPQVPHTDLGSLTFLFAPSPGLQILRPGADEWAYVQPRAGHAVVNLGDALSMLTGGLLRSSLHRVGPLPGGDMPERYSFAFLMRPENEISMRPVKSPMITPTQYSSRESQPNYTSGEWIARKFGVLRAGTNKEKISEDWILTSAIKSY
jgi:isopenicillin N synthase-like dioxygenase